MIERKNHNKHHILSMLVIICGLLYIFAYQFALPFKADVFLYGMATGLVAMTLLDGKMVLSKQVVLFILTSLSSFAGLAYTTMPTEGMREAILFTFFAVLFWLSLTNPSFIKSFTKWIYIASIVVVLSSVIHFLVPFQFNDLMGQIMREDAYEQLMWSYSVDTTFAGLSAYTPNTTFSAAVLFGNSFLNITNQNETPVIRGRNLNIALLVISVFSIIICSKRGIFVATGAALIVLLFYLYRGKKFLVKFVSAVAISFLVMIVLYNTNEFVATFLNRFTGDDILTGRDTIYELLITEFAKNNLLIGRGTGATYELAGSGAHNIYLQIIYDHGALFSLPYFALLLYNYWVAFKNKCPISIFVQTMFLVYGMSGNPLYSNMFMMIYVYYVLYAAKMPAYIRENGGLQTTKATGIVLRV